MTKKNTLTNMEYESLKHLAMNDGCASAGTELTFMDVNDNTDHLDKQIRNATETEIYNFWYQYTMDCIEALRYSDETDGTE